MISQLLLASDPPNSPAHMVERTKQVQQAASMAFKDICVGGKHHLQVRPRWADGRWKECFLLTCPWRHVTKITPFERRHLSQKVKENHCEFMFLIFVTVKQKHHPYGPCFFPHGVPAIHPSVVVRIWCHNWHNSIVRPLLYLSECICLLWMVLVQLCLGRLAMYLEFFFGWCLKPLKKLAVPCSHPF